MLPMNDVATMLVKHFGYHEGLYDLAFEFQIAVGRIGPTPANLLPGAMLGIARLGLARAEVLNPGTVDASKVNPAPA